MAEGVFAADFIASAILPSAKQALHDLHFASSIAPWSVGWCPQQSSGFESLEAAAYVAVLRLQGWRPPPTLAAPPLLHDSSSGEGVRQGARIAAYGCPFGALVSLKFHSFVSAGIVSAVAVPPNSPANATPPPALVLSDLKSLPGMEGGPVVHNGSGHLLGMLAPPLCMLSSSAELAVVLPAWELLPVVKTIMQAAGKEDGASSQMVSLQSEKPPQSTFLRHHSTLSSALRAIVAIEDGGSWASGVVVTGDGLVLTNAHALPSFPAPSKTRSDPAALAHYTTAAADKLLPKRSVRVLVSGAPGLNPAWHTGRVVHIFSDPLDLAVVQLDNGAPGSNNSTLGHFQTAALDVRSRAVPGQDIVVAGFPLWRPGQGSVLSGPVVTSGNVAKVLPAEGNRTGPSMQTAACRAACAMPSSAVDAVLVTTAAVHSGASGGAVLDPETGTLLGLMTSNTRLERPQPTSAPRAQIFPCLNYSIPAGVLRRVVDALGGSEHRDRRGQGVDWAAIEGEMHEAGIVEVWKGVHSMANEGNRPGEERNRRLPLPPGLNSMLDSMGPDELKRPRPRL